MEWTGFSSVKIILFVCERGKDGDSLLIEGDNILEDGLEDHGLG